jgi:hypothetical protein
MQLWHDVIHLLRSIRIQYLCTIENGNLAQKLGLHQPRNHMSNLELKSMYMPLVMPVMRTL